MKDQEPLTPNGCDAMCDESRDRRPEIRMLDPRQVEIKRDANNRLQLALKHNGETHQRVKITRAFPLSRPDQYISFVTEEDKEIGMVVDLNRIESHSRRIIEEELDQVYFIPIIERIFTVQSRHGSTTWQVKTDRGETTIFIKDRGDIRRLPGRRILLQDVHGLKYDIPDYARLDDRSRAYIDTEI